MNWRRRELLRSRIPHALLISHNTKAFVLPIIADFDVQYFTRKVIASIQRRTTGRTIARGVSL